MLRFGRLLTLERLPMANAVNIDVQAGAAQQTITLQLEPRPQQWTDISVYAPTFPGLIVAILGLWIAHRLTVARDRRKQILELSEDTKDAVQEAEAACVAAWLSPIEDRSSAVATAKSKLQAAGIVATDLRRRSSAGLFRHLKYLFVNCTIAVDVVNDVGRLRDIATGDPFDNPTRGPDTARVSDISAKVAEIQARINLQTHELYG